MISGCMKKIKRGREIEKKSFSWLKNDLLKKPTCLDFKIISQCTTKSCFGNKKCFLKIKLRHFSPRNVIIKAIKNNDLKMVREHTLENLNSGLDNIFFKMEKSNKSEAWDPNTSTDKLHFKAETTDSRIGRSAVGDWGSGVFSPTAWWTGIFYWLQTHTDVYPGNVPG